MSRFYPNFPKPWEWPLLSARHFFLMHNEMEHLKSEEWAYDYFNSIAPHVKDQNQAFMNLKNSLKRPEDSIIEAEIDRTGLENLKKIFNK